MENKTVNVWSPGLSSHDGKYSPNLGDLIIQDAVKAALFTDLKLKQAALFSSHAYLSDKEKEHISNADFTVVGGSNLLSSHSFPTPKGVPIKGIYRQWKISHRGALTPEQAEKVVLMGVGWWKYQSEADPLTKNLYEKHISKNLIHSARDNYTLGQIRKAGFDNAMNTGCPTLWEVSQDVNDSPKKDTVLFTLTDYGPSEKDDLFLINLVKEKYKKVYFWVQGKKDLVYLKSLTDITDINILEGTSEVVNELAKKESIDYIGTRLHCGIRSLQLGCRSMILEISARAKEMGADFNLPTIDRANHEAISKWVDQGGRQELKLPFDNIKEWKSQFSK